MILKMPIPECLKTEAISHSSDHILAKLKSNQKQSGLRLQKVQQKLSLHPQIQTIHSLISSSKLQSFSFEFDYSSEINFLSKNYGTNNDDEEEISV
jgi:hypothetical protein